MKKAFFHRTAALALLHLLGSTNAGAQQPQPLPAPTSFTLTKSATLVEGVQLLDGRPVSGVVLTSRLWTKKHCDQPVEIRTDCAGRFRYRQMSGLASFTCYNPCARDPSSLVWFDVWKEGRPWRVFLADMGFHLSHVELTCDFGQSKGERMPMPSCPRNCANMLPWPFPTRYSGGIHDLRRPRRALAGLRPASGQLCCRPCPVLGVCHAHGLCVAHSQRIAGHGLTLYAGGLPATRLDWGSATQLRCGAVAMHGRHAG